MLERKKVLLLGGGILLIIIVLVIGLRPSGKKTDSPSFITQEFDLSKDNEVRKETEEITSGVIPEVTGVTTGVTPTPVTGSETMSMVPSISPTQIPTAVPTGEITPTLIPTTTPTRIPTPTARPTEVIINPSGVSLSATKAVLYVGEKQEILSKVEPDTATNKEINWSSSNNNIAEVNNDGLITAINAGEAVITVRTSNNKTNTVRVEVRDEKEGMIDEEEEKITEVEEETEGIKAESISLNIKNVLLSVNKRQQISINFIPNKATDKSISWSSSNPNVATVTNNGLITTKSPGTTTITAKTNNNKTATATVTVSGGQVTVVPTRIPTAVNNPTSKPTTVVTAVPIKKELKMAVIADIHNNTGGLKTMLNRAKTRGSEIIIIAGDLTNNGTDSELSAVKKVVNGSEVRVAVTQGNHDIRKGLFSKYFGQSYQSVRFGGIKLIIIDNSNWKGLGDVQKKWIESELPECRTIICVTIMHMPLNNPNSAHVMGEDSKTTAAEADWLRKLLIENKVRETISGHIHHAYSYTLGGIKTTLVGSGGATIYSEFLINDKQITRTVVNK